MHGEIATLNTIVLRLMLYIRFYPLSVDRKQRRASEKDVSKLG